MLVAGHLYRVLFLGAPAVGKTSLISRCLGQTPPEFYEPTSDETHRRSVRCGCGATRMNLELDDTSGERLFPSMRGRLITTAQTVAIVFSLDDARSLDEADEIFQEVLDLRPERAATPPSPHRSEGVKGRRGSQSSWGSFETSEPPLLLLVGCKADLATDYTLSTKMAEATAARWGCPYVAVSAESGQGVDNMLNLLLPDSCAECQRRIRQPAEAKKRTFLSRRRSSSAGRLTMLQSSRQAEGFLESLRRVHRWHILAD